MKLTGLLPLILLVFSNCDWSSRSEPLQVAKVSSHIRVESTNTTYISDKLMDRIKTPEGYSRTEAVQGSFASYLRNLKLKEKGSPVKYYNGNTKYNNDVYTDVIDLPIGRKDLHQCADAVMRLRAEYLWAQRRFSDIHFNLTNGFRMDYNKWMQGYRVKVDGNKTSWFRKMEASNSAEDFWSYLEFVFTYAGTASLSKELKAVNLMDMQIGDVLIQGGYPGHAVIVLDMAINDRGEQLFLLGQSYMPAQEIQILVNRNQPGLSPWYPLDDSDNIVTPEWVFKSTDLKRFAD